MDYNITYPTKYRKYSKWPRMEKIMVIHRWPGSISEYVVRMECESIDNFLNTWSIDCRYKFVV